MVPAMLPICSDRWFRRRRLGQMIPADGDASDLFRQMVPVPIFKDAEEDDGKFLKKFRERVDK
ncbi:hypothetical protein HanIR_Chr01g0003191 [Helianthus annuus]|nr:hypothetical protein HanIR_Chr01g0003191 [Helianthus annuus]